MSVVPPPPSPPSRLSGIQRNPCYLSYRQKDACGLAGEGRGELVAYHRELLLHVGGELVVVVLDAVEDVGLKQKTKK